MTEFHELDDSAESAAEFLRKMSAGAVPIAARTGGKPGPKPRRRRAARRGAPIPTASVHGTGAQPWVSGTASLLVWGAGQWLNGQRQLAILCLTLQGLAAALFYCFARSWASWAWLAGIFAVPEQQMGIAAFATGGIVPWLAVGIAIQAYYHAARHPRARVFSGPPAIPAVASAVVPGWGQILNDQIGKASVFLLLALSGAYVVAVSLRWPAFWSQLDPTPSPLAGVSLSAVSFGAVAGIALTWVVSAYDAYITARRQDAEPGF